MWQTVWKKENMKELFVINKIYVKVELKWAAHSYAFSGFAALIFAVQSKIQHDVFSAYSLACQCKTIDAMKCFWEY